MKKADRSIDILKEDPRNPRTVSDEALAGLSASVTTFGDLSLIVFNERTGVLVGGHQRLKTLRAAGAKEFVREPGAQFGYIEDPKTKERFTIRFVDWDENKQRLANLTANNPHIQGEFNDDAVAQLRELEELEGFDALKLEALQEELLAGATKAKKKAKDDEGKDETEKLTDGFMIIIDCKDEAQQIELLGRFMGENLKCRALT